MYDGLYYVLDSDEDSDNELYGKNQQPQHQINNISRKQKRILMKKAE